MFPARVSNRVDKVEPVKDVSTKVDFTKVRGED